MFKKSNIAIFLVLLLLSILLLLACGGDDANADDNRKSNDTVLHEDQYQEFYKQEGRGDKNYLYTKTEFDNEKGEHCTVITGDSENWGDIFCSSNELIPPIEANR